MGRAPCRARNLERCTRDLTSNARLLPRVPNPVCSKAPFLVLAPCLLGRAGGAELLLYCSAAARTARRRAGVTRSKARARARLVLTSHDEDRGSEQGHGPQVGAPLHGQVAHFGPWSHPRGHHLQPRARRAVDADHVCVYRAAACSNPPTTARGVVFENTFLRDPSARARRQTKTCSIRG